MTFARLLNHAADAMVREEVIPTTRDLIRSAAGKISSLEMDLAFARNELDELRKFKRTTVSSTMVALDDARNKLKRLHIRYCATAKANCFCPACVIMGHDTTER